VEGPSEGCALRTRRQPAIAVVAHRLAAAHRLACGLEAKHVERHDHDEHGQQRARDLQQCLAGGAEDASLQPDLGYRVRARVRVRVRVGLGLKVGVEVGGGGSVGLGFGLGFGFGSGL